MRGKGIAYDTGFVRGGKISRTRFDLDEVKRELTIIRDDLHCNALHVIGGDPERLELASRLAAELGLEVWFSPYPLELTADEVLSLFVDCAERAERLRKGGAEVVFVTGVELSLMARGFLPGGTVAERLGLLLGSPDQRERLVEVAKRLNDFFAKAVAAVRERFHGKVTYASIPFERIDWSLFDIISIELIRSAEVADQFADAVRRLVAGGKPVAITGFGSTAWRGAGDVAPRAMDIVEYDKESGVPLRLSGDYVRDEAGQAAYLREVLDIFDTGGVDSAFVYLFELENFPHRPDGSPRDDLDMASPGIVAPLEHSRGRTYPEMRWEPKLAFHAVAECYGK